MANHNHQRGLSIVELLVGLAIGLTTVGAATSMLGTSVFESRRLLGEDRVLQDLRAAADVVGRNLRRSGHWGDAAAALATGQPNPYAAPAPAGGSSVELRYSRDATENHRVDSDEQFGFRLRRGVLEMQVGSAGWQALTDANQLAVTAFDITPTTEDTVLPCPDACRAGSTTCPPRQQRVSVAITVAAQSAQDARVVRELRSQVHLRNGAVIGRCDA